VYLQDDWRVTKKLTLNLGLRYDLDTPRTERYDRMNYFDPGASSPLASKVPGYSNLTGGLVFVGINGRPRSQYKRDNNNVAPRFGFAYQVSSTTSIRGGFGNIFAISLQQAHCRPTIERGQQARGREDVVGVDGEPWIVRSE